MDEMASQFMFATGIENSIPTIQNGRIPGGRDGKMFPLSVLGKRFFLGSGAGNKISALWTALTSGIFRPGSI